MRKDEPKFLIYELEDPRNRRGFYVGKSCQGLDRPKSHMEPGSLERDTNKYKVNKIKAILKTGKRPIINILEVFEDPIRLAEAEIEWIAEYRRAGVKLTNLSDGGEGLFNPPAETRAKMSAAKKGPKSRWYGVPMPEEWRLNLKVTRIGPGNPQYGKKASPETKAKMSKTRTGKKFPNRKAHSKESDARGAVTRSGTGHWTYGKKPFIDNLGNVYLSVVEAATVVGVLASGVNACLNRPNRQKTAGGRSFKYLTDEEIKERGL